MPGEAGAMRLPISGKDSVDRCDPEVSISCSSLSFLSMSTPCFYNIYPNAEGITNVAPCQMLFLRLVEIIFKEFFFKINKYI